MIDVADIKFQTSEQHVQLRPSRKSQDYNHSMAFIL